MLLLRNVNFVTIVQLNFYFPFSMFFFIKKATSLVTTKNTKKILKLTKKNIIYVASSNTHSLATGLCVVLRFQLY